MNHTEEWEKALEENFYFTTDSLPIEYKEWLIEKGRTGIEFDIENDRLNTVNIGRFNSLKYFILNLLSTQREEILAKVDRIPVPHLYVNGEMIPDSNFLSNRELIKQSLKGN